MLLATDGVANSLIAERADVTVHTVLKWRERYQSTGIEGLADVSRPGWPRTLDHVSIVTATLRPPPKKLGVTRWSTRLLAERLKVSAATVARVWRAYGIQPWRSRSFRFSTEPELVGKVTDICGPCLAPPAERDRVLCR